MSGMLLTIVIVAYWIDFLVFEIFVRIYCGFKYFPPYSIGSGYVGQTVFNYDSIEFILVQHTHIESNTI